jgi:hypothetical protein
MKKIGQIIIIDDPYGKVDIKTNKKIYKWLEETIIRRQIAYKLSHTKIKHSK